MAGENLKQVSIVVSGRVQGVLFRSNTKKQADDLKLVGWVRNTPDGRVEILAQGEKGDLEKLISWCKKGPLFAKVEEVEVSWQTPSEILTSFEIVY